MSARTSEPSSRLLLACLMDHTVYARHLQRAWLTPHHLESTCSGAASCRVPAGRSSSSRAVARRVSAALVPLCLSLSFAPLARSCCLARHGGWPQQQPPPRCAGGAAGTCSPAAPPSSPRRGRGRHAPYAPPASQLVPLCSTPGAEPVTDLSVPYPAGRAYVLGCHNLHVFDLQGAHLAMLFMGGWAQAAPAADLGAFSWPLPTSSRVAVHLDATGVVRRGTEDWGLPAAAAACAGPCTGAA
jgi:hypothetical protein